MYLDVMKDSITEYLAMGKSQRKIAKLLNVPRSTLGDYLRAKNGNEPKENIAFAEEKALVLDIESAPISAHVWSMWQQGVGLNQIVDDWHLLSFAAKWYGEPEDKVIYMDQSQSENIEDDFELCYALRELINQASYVITQNGRKFDMKKINARMIINGLPPMRPVKIIDTLEFAKREFGFTSNRLEYMTDKLCTKYKKLKHEKFSGHTLWMEVLKGNQEAWAEMKEYNIHDILSLEELYGIMKPYSIKHPNVCLPVASDKPVCRVCASDEIVEDGHWYSSLSKYKMYRCENCGAYSRSRSTVTTKEQRSNVTMAPLS